jgi:hypothetical protein
VPSRAAALQVLSAPDPALANTFGDVGGPSAMPMPDGSVNVDLAGGPMVTEGEDGSITIDTDPPADNPPTVEFNGNLAEHMEESVLTKLATQIIDWKESDEKSRADWYAMLTNGMALLGLKIEDRNIPFQGASGVVDTIMLEAVLRNQAQTSAELLPAAGPVKTQIIGTPNEEVEQRAARVASWFNYYLGEAAPEWVEDMEQMFVWRALCGSTFKKVYQDPILHRPVSPWIGPHDLVFSENADASLEKCQRVTQVIKSTFKEIRERQLSGFYRDISLMMPQDDGTPNAVQEKVDSVTGIQPQQDESHYLFDKDFVLLECHADLVLEGFEDDSAPPPAEMEGEESDEPDPEKTPLPLPYIVTVEMTTKKILAIRRNWNEGDETFAKNNFFVHYRFIPGLGAMGIGYAHILGNPAKAATALQRQMIDAETLSMFPGGLRVKGMRMSDNNIMVGPCEFIEVDTGGLPINQAVAPMPYKGASEVSLALWEKGRQNAQQLGSMSDISVGDGRQDAPVGTTLALLEAANRMMSATVKSAHRSLKRELKLYYALFAQYLPEKPYPFPVSGGQKSIMRQDFAGDVNVIPVSDPNITSYAQRVTQAEARLRIAQQFPQVHDIRAACHQMYVAMGTDDEKINAILPPPAQGVPTDPLSENQMAMVGKPIAVGEYQDHQAHVQAHSVMMEQVPTLAAHISEHLAAAMRVNVQKELGIQLPPMGTKLPPEIENRIAVLVAQALQKLKDPAGPEPTPGQIAMAEIQVEAQKVQAKYQEIQAQAATAAFKEQMANKRAAEDRQARTATDMLRLTVERQKVDAKKQESRFGARRKV